MPPDACAAEATGRAARRRFLPLAAMLPAVLLLAAAGCTVETADEDASVGQEAPAAAYDSALAARLGADEYGMRPYVVALLTAGPNRDVDSATAAELQRAHLENVFRMADEGSLLLQGPFLDDGTLRGFYIFNVTTVEEARALTETDPAIQHGWLAMELRPWYGYAALQEVYDIHRQVRQRNP